LTEKLRVFLFRVPESPGAGTFHYPGLSFLFYAAVKSFSCVFDRIPIENGLPERRPNFSSLMSCPAVLFDAALTEQSLASNLFLESKSFPKDPSNGQRVGFHSGRQT
jgi:hypothetical protein